MTETIYTTTREGTEVSALAHTPLSRGFCGLLRDLEAILSAERLLQRGVLDSTMMDFGVTLTAVETAREALTSRLGVLNETAEERGEDRPLRLMALLLQTLLGVEDDGDRAYLYATVSEHTALLQVTGSDPTAKLVRRLQHRFFAGLATLMDLEDFGRPRFDPDAGMMAMPA